MRLTRFLLLPACLAFLFGGAAAALSCCGSDAIRLPASVQRGVVVGAHFYGVTTEGRLLDVDLDTEKVKEFTDLGVKVGPTIDARGNTICVSAGQKLLLVDAKTGKITRELECGANVRSVSFAADDRLYIHTTKNLDVIDLKTGKAIESKPARSSQDPHFHGTDVWAVGGKVYVASTVNSYGVPMTNLSILDSKSGKAQPVRLPAHICDVSTMVAGPDGSLYLTNREGQTFRLDAEGKVASQMRASSKGALMGFYSGQPVMLVGGRMLVIDMPLQTVKSK